MRSVAGPISTGIWFNSLAISVLYYVQFKKCTSFNCAHMLTVVLHFWKCSFLTYCWDIVASIANSQW